MLKKSKFNEKLLHLHEVGVLLDLYETNTLITQFALLHCTKHLPIHAFLNTSSVQPRRCNRGNTRMRWGVAWFYGGLISMFCKFQGGALDPFTPHLAIACCSLEYDRLVCSQSMNRRFLDHRDLFLWMCSVCLLMCTDANRCFVISHQTRAEDPPEFYHTQVLKIFCK